MTAEHPTRRRRIAGFFKGLVSSPTSNPLQNQKRRVVLAAAVLIAGAGIPFTLGLYSGGSEAHIGNAVGLDKYRLLQPPIELSMLVSNASGITYNPDTDTLFAISNSPTYVVEMDKQGRELRKIALDGFQDTEDLTYLGEGRFAIVEERLRSVVIVDIDGHTQSVDRSDSRSMALPQVNDGRNKGFEGIAYDPEAQSLFVVNEDEPRQLFRIDGFVDEADDHFSVTHPWDLEENSLGKKDLSGVHFDRATGHLLMLSDESRSLTESTVAGQKISKLSMSIFRAGFTRNIRQAEGVAMDDHGTLYILSEPNLLYLLGPEKSANSARAPQNGTTRDEPSANPLQTGQKKPT